MTDYVVNIIIVDLIMSNKESHIYIYLYAKHRENFPINKDHLHIMITNWSMLQIISSFYLLPLDRFSLCALVLQDKHDRVPILGSSTRLRSHPIAKFEMARNLNNTRNQLYFIITQLIAFIITFLSLITLAIYQEFLFLWQNNKSFHPGEGIFLNYCLQFLNYRDEYSVIFSRGT